jgi:hypothetical protein
MVGGDFLFVRCQWQWQLHVQRLRQALNLEGNRVVAVLIACLTADEWLLWQWYRQRLDAALPSSQAQLRAEDYLCHKYTSRVDVTCSAAKADGALAARRPRAAQRTHPRDLGSASCKQRTISPRAAPAPAPDTHDAHAASGCASAPCPLAVHSRVTAPDQSPRQLVT